MLTVPPPVALGAQVQRWYSNMTSDTKAGLERIKIQTMDNLLLVLRSLRQTAAETLIAYGEESYSAIALLGRNLRKSAYQSRRVTMEEQVESFARLAFLALISPCGIPILRFTRWFEKALERTFEVPATI